MDGKHTIVVALDGNAILQPYQEGTLENQMENLTLTSGALAGLVAAEHRLTITHDNGPQVGAILLQNEASKDQVPPMPLDVCGAKSQGMLGYLFQQSLINALNHRGLNRVVATVVSQVIVNPHDPAFQNPTKPVGPFYSEEGARALARDKGYQMREDAGRGWRRVVPSPDPVGIVESPAISTLVDAGVIVIAAGGGGAPVRREASGLLAGVEAVIDKDLAGQRLAKDLKADGFIILTDVEGAYINYGTPRQQLLRQVSLAEIERYQEEGHFRAGSMGPKVEACLRFIREGGEYAIISSISKVAESVAGTAGTRITK